MTHTLDIGCVVSVGERHSQQRAKGDLEFKPAFLCAITAHPAAGKANSELTRANTPIQKFSWECGDKPPLRAQPYSLHR